MQKLISTRTHGILDYVTVGFALAFPRFLPCKESTKNAITTLFLGKLGYAMLTQHEMGLYKLIGMKTHLALDCMGGATLCAIPFMTDEDDPGTIACCVGLGLFDIAAAPISETQMRGQQPYISEESSVAHHPEIARVEADRSGWPASAMRDTGAHATPGV